jgi:hypothetical protein
MSIATILLIAVAVGVTFLMLRTARGARGAAESIAESARDVGDLRDAGEQAVVNDRPESVPGVAPAVGPQGGSGRC